MAVINVLLQVLQCLLLAGIGYLLYRIWTDEE